MKHKRKRSVMNHSFSQVPQANIQRSRFNRSHGHKTTFDEGFLIPILVDEVLPGDTFSVRMTAFTRLATPFHPIMDNMRVDTHFFAVPNRLVWDNWQKFNGEQENPEDSVDYQVPHMALAGGSTEGTIYDYMGIPLLPDIPIDPGVNTLHFRAYNLIWNEWFRDQNLQDSLKVNKSDDGDLQHDFVLKRRGKRHDYFTSCLPWPQKGDSVTLPLGDSAPIVMNPHTHVSSHVVPASVINVNAGSAVFPKTLGVVTDDEPTGIPVIDTASSGFSRHSVLQTSENPDNLLKVNIPSVNLQYPTGAAISTGVADLTDATASTINELRLAFQVQKLLERDARGGTRYTEIIRSHFGVVSPDARLQRPEYLGGGSQPITVTPVGQTSESSSESPQGNLAAIGTNVVHGNGFSKSFTEHCLLIGLISVRADLTYQEGLNRMWSRRSRYDYYWPALSHIGEQAVYNREIHYLNPATQGDVFGYQERFSEYRYKPSMITGKFRSAVQDSLDVWHLSQDFGLTMPLLGDTFIQETPPVERVVVVRETQPHFLMDAFFDMYCTRPMPIYAIPGKIDHF